MPKRTKKPAVRPDLAREWARRHEQEGESPPQIARTDGYDVRTVRKYLESASQERETREARSVVLRQALEQHYTDLIEFAMKLRDNAVSPMHFPMPGRSERLYSALRQHLPRAPLWKALDRWDELHKQRFKLRDSAVERMLKMVEAEGLLPFVVERQSPGFRREGLSNLTAERLEALGKASGQSPDLPDLREPICEPMGTEGAVQMAWNGWICAVASPDERGKAVSFVQNFVSDISGWSETEGMRRTLSELGRVNATLVEELETLRLRRVLPGRCKYCSY